jgi:hypothetical protein
MCSTLTGKERFSCFCRVMCVMFDCPRSMTYSCSNASAAAAADSEVLASRASKFRVYDENERAMQQ